MTYTEKELDQFLHGISLSLLSKKSAQHWRYDEETAKEIEWLEALERKVRADKADRKTENSSEIPNNCEDCEHWNDTEDGCADRHGCKDEPQAGEMMTEEEFDSMLARVLTGKDEPQTDIGASDTVYSDTAGYVLRVDMTDCSWK